MIHDVTDTAGLAAAVSAAQSGDTIRLAPGKYDELRIVDRVFDPPLYIKSASEHLLAEIARLVVSGSDNVVMRDLWFHYAPKAGDKLDHDAFVVGNSRRIFINASVFRGDGDADGYGTGLGLAVLDSAACSVRHCEFDNFWKAVDFEGVTDCIFANNDVHNIRVDGMKIRSIDGLLIERNWFHDFQLYLPGDDHRDFIQGWNLNAGHYIRRLTIHGNFFDTGSGPKCQMIFISNSISTPMENILVTNNILYGAHVNGVHFGSTAGLIFSGNTMLFAGAATRHPTNDGPIDQPNFRFDDNGTYTGVVMQNNVLARVDPRALPASAVFENNLHVPADMIGDVFQSAAHPMALADFMPLTGSAADVNGLGARVTSVGTGDPAPLPDPVPDPDPEPDPVPDPEPTPDPTPDPTTEARIAALEESTRILQEQIALAIGVHAELRAAIAANANAHAELYARVSAAADALSDEGM